jgi:hypothetical protein
MKNLPFCKNYGIIKLDNFTIYNKDLLCVLISDNKCINCNSNDNPIIYIDLEKNEKNTLHFSKNFQIHLGIVADRIHQQKIKEDANFKSHIDIYISVNELDNIIQILRKIQFELKFGVIK